MSPLKFTHYAHAQTEFKPPLIANENAFLGDVATSEPNDPIAPISGGFYRLEKGTPLIYEYTYHEIKIIVDGEFEISDASGQTVHAVKGDVFYCERYCIRKVDGLMTDDPVSSPQRKQDYIHDGDVWLGLLCRAEKGS